MIKIFKNKVGRPSNETIRKRRIIVSSFVAVVAFIIIACSYMLSGSSSKLEGKATANISVDYDCNTVYGSNSEEVDGSKCKKLKIEIRSNEKVYFSYKLGNNKTYTLSKNNPKTVFEFDVVEAFKKSKLAVPSIIDEKITVTVYNKSAQKIDSKTVTLKQNGYAGATYYYNQQKYPTTPFCGRTLKGYGEDGCISSCRDESICCSGCGGVSLAMAFSTLAQKEITPEEVSTFMGGGTDGKSKKYTCGTGVNGTTGSATVDIILDNGYSNKFNEENGRITTTSVDELVKWLSADKTGKKRVAVVSSDGDCFTNTQHYHFISGVDISKNLIYLYDPNDGISNSRRKNCSWNEKPISDEATRNGAWDIDTYERAVNKFEAYLLVVESSLEPTKIKNSNPTKLTLTCDNNVKVGKKGICRTNMSGVKLTLSDSGKLSSSVSQSFVTTSSDMTKSFSYSKAGTYKITASKSGYDTVTTNIKIVDSANNKKTTKTTTKRPTTGKATTTAKKLPVVKFECPLTVKVNQEFECKAYDSGVDIQVFGVNGLAKGYDTQKTTWFLSKNIKVKFDSNLFENYKNKIVTDSKGQYILVNVVASKNGYSKNTQSIRIYNDKKVQVTNKTMPSLSFTCPSTAKVGENIICKTDQAGVTIRTSNPESLVTGYTEKYVTTPADFTKSLSYTKTGTYYVKASKNGYKDVVKTIKVTNPTSGLVLSCPSSVYVNEPIICTTNMVGVTIRGSNAESLASGVSDRFVTTSTDLSKTLKYKKAGTYYVKASKSGYGEVKKAITVKNRVVQTTVNKNTEKGIYIILESIDTPLGNKKDKRFKVKLDSKGNKVKYYTYVICNTLNECKASNAYTIVKDKYGASAVTNRKYAITGFTDTLEIRTYSESMAGKTYYLRIATYDKDKAENMLHKAVFKIDVNIVSGELKHTLTLLEDTVWFK